MTNYRELIRLRNLGLNHSQIAEALGVSRTTVIRTLQRSTAQGLDWRAVETMSDKEIAARLYPQGEGKPSYTMPDYDWVHREMARPGVTLQLLWMEYSDKCHSSDLQPYQFTQFKKYYRDYLVKTKATMHIQHKPGELLEVDWAGQTTQLVDPNTGEILDVYVFVAVLPYSGYAYAEAFSNREQDAWIAAHVNTFNFFGGAARILVPDNLKTGVIKNTRGELVLNKTYQELAAHYGTAIIPARVRKPKDKASVEGAVGYVSTFILAAIRNQRFFSLRELNESIPKHSSRNGCTS